MLNMLSLIMGLLIAPPRQIAAVIPEPVQTVTVSRERRVENPPRKENGNVAEDAAESIDEEFSMDDYAVNKQNLDAKYSRRTELRKKLAEEIADFLADYEEYCALSRSYERELRRIAGGNKSGEEASRRVPRPVMPDESAPSEPDNRLSDPPGDGNGEPAPGIMPR